MQKNNKLIIAAAGAGKTTFLVNEALNKVNDTILITTYTNSNHEEIVRKIIKKNSSIPANITVQTWVSFLMQHGVKPYQGYLYEKKIRGYLPVHTQSGLKKVWQGKPIYFKEDGELEQYFFSATQKIYSDKLAKFVFRCNEKSNGEVVKRLSRIYSHIFIDEIQDLAGYDLEIIKLLFSSNSNVLLVGDPRQVTYLTHHEKQNSQYSDGRIEQFLLDKCKSEDCLIDKVTLIKSHRNNKSICDFSSALYPNHPTSEPCDCVECRNYLAKHEGIFLVQLKDVSNYMNEFEPIVLRYREALDSEWNFGESKGLSFDRVLIYPTDTIIKYLKDGELTKIKKTKSKKTGIIKEEIRDAFDIAKFYVAVTRARYSVGIVCDYKNETFISGLCKYVPNENSNFKSARNEPLKND